MQGAARSIAPWVRTCSRRPRFHDVAVDEVFGDDPPGQDDEWLLEPWVAGIHHGVLDEQGRRLVDIMLADCARLLPPAHAAALRSLSTAWFSVFRVERVDLDQGILICDTIDDRERYVHEKSGTHYAHALDVIVAFVSTTGGVEMFQGIAQVPPIHTLAVIDEHKRLLANARTSDRVAATALTWGATLGYLRRLVRDWRPVMHHTDGEPLLPSKAHYDVLDDRALRAALSSAPDLDHDERGWGWRRGDGDGALSLGRLTLDGRALILEVNSRERLARGKELIAALAGAAVKHRLDEHTDVDRLLEAARAGQPRTQAGDDLPEHVRREIIATALQRAYANVLDEPVPALDNMTPRRAAATSPEQKQRVREWLDGLEHSLHTMPGGPEAVDVDEWRVELGIAPRHGDDDEGLDGPAWLDVLDPDLVEQLAKRVERDQRAWLDEPTPLLEGATPRAAAKDALVRPVVHLLVDGVAECSSLSYDAIEAMAREIGLYQTTLRDDPRVPPDPDTWLGRHSREREGAIAVAHESGPHPPIADRFRHLIEHHVVEEVIARGSPPATRALDRLLGLGLTRQEAIHALGETIGAYLDTRLASYDANGDDSEDHGWGGADAAMMAIEPTPWRGTAP